MTRLLTALLLLWGAWPPLPPAPSAWPPPLLGLALADDGDGDGDDSDDDDDDDRLAPSPTTLARSLRLASVWVERRPGGLVALRAGLERGGVLVGTITLDPFKLEPVNYPQRGLAQPRTLPTAAALRAALARLGGLAPSRITLGRYAVASAGGTLLPLYWAGRHVASLTLDPRGQPRPDAAAARAEAASPLKVRR